MFVAPCPCMTGMPPRDLYDSNPVYRREFFHYYLEQLFVSNPEVFGMPMHMIEDSELTEAEYNELVARESPWDIEIDSDVGTVALMMDVDSGSDDGFEREELGGDSDSEASTVDLTTLGTRENPIDLTRDSIDFDVIPYGYIRATPEPSEDGSWGDDLDDLVDLDHFHDQR